MNRGKCRSCQNSFWVKKANIFVKNSSKPKAQVETIRFLLHNRHCGINNRTSIKKILMHLNNKGIRLSRESFQYMVLTELKRGGIIATLIYPGSKGGVFIPCSENELKTVTEQVFRRITQELDNLAGVVMKTHLSGLVNSAKQQIEILKDQI